jgi:tetratricopeptide (TPR) repeat protein
MIQFKSGSYDEASESFYNASLEDPRSQLVKVFLGISLFAIGEYHYSAEYLRLGLSEWPAFPAYRWSVRSLYGNQEDLASQLAVLEDEVRWNPASTDASLVLAFLGLSGAAPTKAPPGEPIDRLRELSEDPVDLVLAARYTAEVEQRSGISSAGGSMDVEEVELAHNAADSPAIQAFLTSLELKDVPALPIR